MTSYNRIIYSFDHANQTEQLGIQANREEIKRRILGYFYHEAFVHFFKNISNHKADVKIAVARKGNSLAMAYDVFSSQNPSCDFFQHNALPFRGGAGELNGKSVLIIDDIAIGGNTLIGLVEELISVYGVDESNIRIALFAYGPQLFEIKNSAVKDDSDNSKIEKKRRLCEKIINSPLELDESQLLRLSSLTTGLIYAMSVPYVSYTPAFRGTLDLSGKISDAGLFCDWDREDVTAEYQSLNHVRATYYKLVACKNRFAAVRLYHNLQLKEILVIPIVFMPPMSSDGIASVFDNVSDILDAKKIKTYINGMKNNIKPLAQYRWLHFVFSYCALRKFATSCSNFDLMQHLTPMHLNESFNCLGDNEKNSYYILQGTSNVVINDIWEHLPPYYGFEDYSSNDMVSFTRTLRRKLYIMGGHEGEYEDTNLYEFIKQHKFNPSSCFWEIQKVLDCGEATMRAKVTDIGVESFAKAGEQAHQYILQLNEPNNDMACPVGYMISNLQKLVPDFDSKRLEIKTIFDKYVSNKEIQLHDEDGFDLYFSSGRRKIGHLFSSEVSECMGATFFLGMVLHYPSYVASGSQDFGEYLHALDESDYVDALKEGLLNANATTTC